MLSFVALLAQAEDEGGSPLTKIIPGLMIWTIIVFGITLFVLWKFAFGPIQTIIDERRKRIRQALEEADHARSEARRLLEEHKELRARARSDAEEVLAEARRVADSMRERVREETEADRQRRLEETRKQVEAETQRALEEIRAEIADLALVAAERVTRQALDRPEQRRLIDEAIKDLDFSALETTR
jgi:F-type H+-transporting ATPase subunit b